MIDAPRLLKSLQALLRRLEDDLREQIDRLPELGGSLQAEHAAAHEAGRTAQGYAAWREEPITQAAVAWILGAVFVRFLEDNYFLDHPWLSGPSERRRRADDEHTLYFRSHPEHSDRDYLLHVFSQVELLPAGAELFDRRHNPLWRFPISGDAAGELRELLREIDPASGKLVHDFQDAQGDTRFLGDLYQDLSEPTRKRYALLQTPEFVERFLLDRTLTPAIEEFGWREVRLIDPTCGSGHFLLGTFHRLLELRRSHEPGVPEAGLAQRALDGVYGVDVNPFAVRIARFRLLVAALRACGISRLADAPAFRIHVAAGDSLLHGRRFRSIAGVQRGLLEEADPLRHVFETEDAEELDRILGQQYHAVVGNPPYITPKDKALNVAYRARYGSCSGKYSLVVPFLERFFDLAIEGDRTKPAAHIGLIVANSFMKRQFGKKLIEQHLPSLDLTHIIDASGAYIPGHGTPTAFLFGQHRRPVEPTVRAVLGIRGEPETPANPAHGLVWSAILAQVDQPGSESEFVSVDDLDRNRFRQHPWSLQGGGAVELKKRIEDQAEIDLRSAVELVGVFGMTNADDVMLASYEAFIRQDVSPSLLRRMTLGEEIRDWDLARGLFVLWPYDDEKLKEIQCDQGLLMWLWPVRTVLGNRATFSKRTYFEEGRPWWEWHQVAHERLRAPLTITFAFVATHNHFVLDRGGKVFKQSAPIIKLPPGTSEDEHLMLLGLLNSSVACFWMKQVCHNKGTTSHKGILQDDPERFRFEFDGTKMSQFPIPKVGSEPKGHLLRLARALDRRARDLGERNYPSLLDKCVLEKSSIRDLTLRLVEQRKATRTEMVRLQEELDWLVYELYGLIELPEQEQVRGREADLDWSRERLQPNHRPYRLRQHRAKDHRPSTIDAARLQCLKSDKTLGLLERPEYKRRWHRSAGAYDAENLTDKVLFTRQTLNWLLDRLETFWSRDDPAPELRSTAHLADQARADDAFRAVAAVYQNREDVDFAKLVAKLVLGEAVPFLPTQRYKPAGQRKRHEWERTWELQRQEDAIDALTELPDDDPRHITPEEAERRKSEEIGNIPVPPKYRSADFTKPTYWKLRGKLDVPKERFVLYPGAEREGDPSPAICWAGWNALQQAQALATYYLARKDEGWSQERLLPLLAGLKELRPWLLQWHNALDPQFGIGLGTYYADFLAEELRELEATEEDLSP